MMLPGIIIVWIIFISDFFLQTQNKHFPNLDMITFIIFLILFSSGLVIGIIRTFRKKFIVFQKDDLLTNPNATFTSMLDEIEIVINKPYLVRWNVKTGIIFEFIGPQNFSLNFDDMQKRELISKRKIGTYKKLDKFQPGNYKVRYKISENVGYGLEKVEIRGYRFE